VHVTKFYIYAFPVTILLSIWGAARLGYVPFAILSILATVPLAVASWWLIEKQAMKLRQIEWRPAVRRGETPLVEPRTDP